MSQIHTACLQVFASTSRERYSLTEAKKQINVGHCDTSCKITASHTILITVGGYHCYLFHSTLFISYFITRVVNVILL